ncbi:unnamed protein product, partial [Rotaria sp. Silwood1]
MSNDAERQSQFVHICWNEEQSSNFADLVNDSDEEENHSVVQPKQPIEQHDLEDLRQKSSDYEQQQLRGIQLANAGR